MREIKLKYKLEHFCFAQFKPISSMQIFDHDTNPYASDAWIQVFSETADKEGRCKYISGMKPNSTFLSKVLLIFLLVSL